jgi:hypothetical protein
MRKKFTTVLSALLISTLTASPAIARDLDFELNGREIWPGTTNKNCNPGVGGTYATTNITFTGKATGDGRGTWVISLDAQGELDADCEPVRCDVDSPVLITGGNWFLQILLGSVSGPILGGSLAFRPDSLPDGVCLGPVQGDLLLGVDLGLGRLWWVRNAGMKSIFLDHNFLLPVVGAELELAN